MLLLLTAACGDDDGAKATATPDPGAATALPPLETPTPVPDNGPALSVAVNTGASYRPTAAELKALPMSEINADGNKKGVTIATLAQKVDAKAGYIVTIQGINADGKTVAFVRKPLSDLATSTVVIIDAQNHVSLASTLLPKTEWLQAVQSIAFQLAQ